MSFEFMKGSQRPIDQKRLIEQKLKDGLLPASLLQRERLEQLFRIGREVRFPEGKYSAKELNRNEAQELIGKLEEAIIERDRQLRNG